MTSPEVTVVLAVRDDPMGLETAARSILAQREVELELVIVDDGSQDATATRLSVLAAGDRRVRPVRTRPQGLTRALIEGCRAARAPFLARQDAGDYSEPDRLRRQLTLIQSRLDVVFVSCWTRCIGPGGEELQVVTGGTSDDASVDFDPTDLPLGMSKGPSSHGSVLLRRADYEAVGGYREAFRLAQDWDLWWRLVERGAFAAVPQVLYTRTLSPASLSFRSGGAQRQYGELARAAALARHHGESEDAALAAAEALAAKSETPRAARRSEALGFYFIGSLLRGRGDRRAAHYFRRAIRQDPILARAWLRWMQTWI